MERVDTGENLWVKVSEEDEGKGLLRPIALPRANHSRRASPIAPVAAGVLRPSRGARERSAVRADHAGRVAAGC